MIELLRRQFGTQVASEGDSAGLAAAAVVRPVDVEAARELVRFAREHDARLVPVGGGTKQHWIDPPTGNVIRMDTRAMCRVVEYEPEDMTVTVEAGITLGALQKRLAEHGQRLTLDPPHADRATIGGILAANDSGPIRLAFGTARDIVIGMSMIEPDGELIHSGGKVVKNVAGYDLHKLYIGSFGTLGPIATVTFKLRPVPEARGVVMLHPEDPSDAERMIRAAMAGQTRPTFIELVSTRAPVADAAASGLMLVIGFEENADAVRWQCERLQSSLGGEILENHAAQEVYDHLRELPGAACRTSFRATMLSSKVADFFEAVRDLPIHVIAHAGSGIVVGLLDEPLDEAAWVRLVAAAAEGRGYLQIRGEWLGPLVRRASRVPNATLSNAIRKAFDPAGTFAPERLVG